VIFGAADARCATIRDFVVDKRLAPRNDRSSRRIASRARSDRASRARVIAASASCQAVFLKSSTTIARARSL
jgi:hypothetical protein